MNLILVVTFIVASTSVLLSVDKGMATVEIEEQQRSQCSEYDVVIKGKKIVEKKLLKMCGAERRRSKRLLLEGLGATAIAIVTSFVTLKLAERKLDKILQTNEQLQEEINEIKNILREVEEIAERRQQEDAIDTLFNVTSTMKILGLLGIKVQQIIDEFGVLKEVSVNALQEMQFTLSCKEELRIEICYNVNPTRRIGNLKQVFLPGKITNDGTIYRHYAIPGDAVQTKTEMISVNRCRTMGSMMKCFEVEEECTVKNYVKCAVENQILKGKCFSKKIGDSYVLATTEKKAVLNRKGNMEMVNIPESHHLILRLEKDSRIIFGACHIDGDFQTHKIEIVPHHTHLEDLVHDEIDKLEENGMKTKEEIAKLREELGFNLDYLLGLTSKFLSNPLSVLVLILVSCTIVSIVWFVFKLYCSHNIHHSDKAFFLKFFVSWTE